MGASSVTTAWVSPLIAIHGAGSHKCGRNCDPHLWLEGEIKKPRGSVVIFDPDESLHTRYSRSLSERGYGITVLDLSNIRMSARYNPFEYISDDKDVVQFAAAFISGTKGLGELGDFSFIALESILLTALIAYVHDEAPLEELNLRTVGEMFDVMVQEDGFYEDGYINAVDYMMEQKAESDPEHLSVRRYRTFRRITGESIQRVVESCAARIAALDTDEMRDFLSTDEPKLRSLGFRNTALFVTPGDDNDVSDFLVPLMYAQLTNELCKLASY